MFFFNDYSYIQNSIKIGKNVDNTKTGEGALLFQDADECKRAYLEKQGQHLGHRWVELYQITFADYQDFDKS